MKRIEIRWAVAALATLWVVAGCATSPQGLPSHQTKSRLNSTIVPWVEFREADLRDVLMFLQDCSVGGGRDSGNNKEVEMFLAMDDAPIMEGTRISCATQNVSLLSLMGTVAGLAGLQYDIRYRGVETKDTNEGVCVLYISKIEKISEVRFEIHYVEYGGPLASHGGSYVAIKTEIGWLIRRGKGGWLS